MVNIGLELEYPISSLEAEQMISMVSLNKEGIS